MNNRIEIGTKFRTSGKNPRTCTVIDVLVTRNSRGEFVRATYLCQHVFMGQTVKHEEVATTILRGIGGE